MRCGKKLSDLYKIMSHRSNSWNYGNLVTLMSSDILDEPSDILNNQITMHTNERFD